MTRVPASRDERPRHARRSTCRASPSFFASLNREWNEHKPGELKPSERHCGEVVSLSPPDNGSEALFYAGIACLAGFSERFARDMMAAPTQLLSAAQSGETADASKASRRKPSAAYRVQARGSSCTTADRPRPAGACSGSAALAVAEVAGTIRAEL
jgi:hypothetical protein